MRTHVAMRLSVEHDDMVRLGIEKVAVSVGENASLLPVPEANDLNPHSDAEVAILTGSLRKVGSKIVDSNKDNMVAARLTSRMINMLPTVGGMGVELGSSVWRQAITVKQQQSLLGAPSTRPARQ